MKIKTLFLMACMCNIFTGCAQSKSVLGTRLLLLQNPSENKFLMDSTGFSKIKNAKFYSKRGDSDVFNINSQNIHIVDFNNDGQKDIIYQETRLHQATVLLVKKDNKFIEIWNGPGVLVDIKQREETSIYVRSNGIGCFPYTMLFELIIKNDNSLMLSTIGHHSDTEVKDLKIKPMKQKLSGLLRTQPIIDNKEKKDSCTGDVMIGNQIRRLDNEEVTILKEQNDWFLVLYNSKDTNLISWIKK